MTHMVDIGEKEDVVRIARAEGKILLKPETVKAILEKRVGKGDVMVAAELAAISAAKRTPELIVHCHPIPLSQVKATLTPESDGIRVFVEVRSVGKTGVEMEALVGASIALLTVWDMVKSLEKDEKGQYPTTAITEIKVLEKIKN